MEKKCKDRCAGCFFLGRSTGTCDYIFIVDQRRPCPPGDECTEFITRKEWDDQMKRLTWDTEIGRQMWLEGKKDSEIADEFGIAASTVAAYRKRHWEKVLPQSALNAIRENAKADVGQEAKLATSADQLIETKDESTKRTKPRKGSNKKIGVNEPPQKTVITVMDVMEAATGHLLGMKAVCTACAIQELFYWHCPEDLRRAQKYIDHLLQMVEEKDGTN